MVFSFKSAECKKEEIQANLSLYFFPFFFSFFVVYSVLAEYPIFIAWEVMNTASENLADLFPVMFAGKVALAENYRLDTFYSKQQKSFPIAQSRFSYVLFWTK